MIKFLNAKYVKHKNLILYALIGFTGVTLDFIIFYILYNFAGLNDKFANIISVSIAISNNFILNILFNFKKRDSFLLRFSSFFIIGILGLAISSVFLEIFHTRAGFDANIIKALSIPIVVAIQYLLNKTISFRDIKK